MENTAMTQQKPKPFHTVPLCRTQCAMLIVEAQCADGVKLLSNTARAHCENATGGLGAKVQHSDQHPALPQKERF